MVQTIASVPVVVRVESTLVAVDIVSKGEKDMVEEEEEGAAAQ